MSFRGYDTWKCDGDGDGLGQGEQSDPNAAPDHSASTCKCGAATTWRPHLCYACWELEVSAGEEFGR